MLVNRIASLFFMLLSWTAAAATTHSSLAQIATGAEGSCENSNYGFRDLIEQVNVVAQQDEKGNIIRDADGNPIDPRDSIDVLGPKLGLSAAEIKTIRETTGYVVCPGTTYRNGSAGSATLVGNGTRILTTAHMFIDQDGLLREPLSECFFQNQAIPPHRTKLDFTSKKMFSEYQGGTGELDLAVVKIVDKITDSHPLQVGLGPNEKRVMPGRKLMEVSSQQQRMKKTFPNSVPIIQGCTMLASSSKTSLGVERGIYSDCAGMKGASGSIQIVRQSNGSLAIAGVHVSGGEAPDYAPFDVDEKTPIEKRSYSFAAEITPKIAAEINAMTGAPPTK